MILCRNLILFYKKLLQLMFVNLLYILYDLYEKRKLYELYDWKKKISCRIVIRARRVVCRPSTRVFQFLYSILRLYIKKKKKKQKSSEKLQFQRSFYSSGTMFLLEFVTIQFFLLPVNAEMIQGIRRFHGGKVKTPINRLLMPTKKSWTSELLWNTKILS